MSSKKVMDMTKGPVLSQMTRFALPVLLGMLCQRIYNFADTYIVGHFLGDGALAAVSIAGTAMYLLFSVMMGVTTGVSVVISQYYGAREEQNVRRTFVAGAWVAAGITLLITAGGMLTVNPLLRLLKTSDALLPDAGSYLLVIYAGCGATMLYNFSASVLRALGNSVVPLVFLIVSSVLNVVLDIVFVAWIPMGTAGAAFATVLSQVISGVLCMWYALRLLPFLKVNRKEWKPDSFLARQVLRYGLPDERHIHLRYDTPGSHQYLWHNHDCRLWCVREGRGTWLSAGGCHRFCGGDLHRAECRGQGLYPCEKGCTQRLCYEYCLLRHFLSPCFPVCRAGHEGIYTDT